MMTSLIPNLWISLKRTDGFVFITEGIFTLGFLSEIEKGFTDDS